MTGLAPTRRPMVVPGLLISRCRDGKIAVEWAQADLLGLLQQLGVMPHLELDKAVVVAQVLRAGALMSRERSPPPSPTGDVPRESRVMSVLTSGALPHRRWDASGTGE